MVSLESAKTLEEKRAALIIKYRGIEVEEESREEDRVVLHLRRGDKRYLMHILLGLKTIGISYVRDLRDAVSAGGFDGGIIVGDGKYTYSARSNAEEMKVELIPPTTPVFDIFQHELIPLHEIVDEEEKQSLREKYHAPLYHFPWLKKDDPIAIIIGAKPGDVVKITQKSQTAGVAYSYRYVV